MTGFASNVATKTSGVDLVVLRIASFARSGIGASRIFVLELKSSAALGSLVEWRGLNCWKRIASMMRAAIVPRMPQRNFSRPIEEIST